MAGEDGDQARSVQDRLVHRTKLGLMTQFQWGVGTYVVCTAAALLLPLFLYSRPDQQATAVRAVLILQNLVLWGFLAVLCFIFRCATWLGAVWLETLGVMGLWKPCCCVHAMGNGQLRSPMCIYLAAWGPFGQPGVQLKIRLVMLGQVSGIVSVRASATPCCITNHMGIDCSSAGPHPQRGLGQLRLASLYLTHRTWQAAGRQSLPDPGGRRGQCKRHDRDSHRGCAGCADGAGLLSLWGA